MRVDSGVVCTINIEGVEVVSMGYGGGVSWWTSWREGEGWLRGEPFSLFSSFQYE